MQAFLAQGQGQIMWDKQCSEVRTEADGRVALALQVEFAPEQACPLHACLDLVTAKLALRCTLQTDALSAPPSAL